MLKTGIIAVAAAACLARTGAVDWNPVANETAWEPLKAGLTAWRKLDLDVDFAVAVGTASGREFLYEADGFTMKSPIFGASLSKWTTSVMIANMVADGVLSFDDLASKHLPFWTTNSSDPRSRMTLASFLSLTSGMQEDSQYVAACSSFDFVKCAELAYKDTTRYTEPRTVWTYLSCHHQFAGAMAVAASGKPMYKLLKEYLYEPFNMKKSVYEPPAYPLMAAGMITDGADLENFLHGMLTYTGTNKSVMDLVETDWTQPPVNLAPRGNFFGHYGMGHMWECFGYAVSDERDPLPLPKNCVDSKIHAGPGDLGVYPLIDRSTGGGDAGPTRPSHYFSLNINEEYNTSGIPEYLRILAKPVSDLILNGADFSQLNSSQLLAAGGGILRRDITYIRGELVSCTCSGAPNATGEPFNSLLDGLPLYTNSTVYRGDLLKLGQGKSMLDIIEIQKKLGECTCTGRY